jgi:hypothetical protein
MSVLEFLQQDEKRAYHLWRGAPWSDPRIHLLHEQWIAALRRLTQEQDARARLGR